MISEVVLKNRDELCKRLKAEMKNSKYYVRPRSPMKYDAKEESTIVICFPDDTHQILGVETQAKEGPFKIWFNEHPEWEIETSYPVKAYAKNGTGAGSGAGFYIESLNHCIAEIKDYLEKFYD